MSTFTRTTICSLILTSLAMGLSAPAALGAVQRPLASSPSHDISVDPAVDPATELKSLEGATSVEKRKVDEISMSEWLSARRDLEPKDAGAFPAVADDVEELVLPGQGAP